VRVFLDANILFSAAKSAGAVRELLHRLSRTGHALCADAYVVEEARRNLVAKGAAAVDSLEAVLAAIEIGPFRPDRLPGAVAALIDEKDRPVLAAAVRMSCDVLLTGDRTHFGELYGRQILGVTVHSPRSLAESLGL
jgi:predicted nucleic acid-binding protein